RTVEAERGNLGGAISVPGTIEWDLRQEHVVSARVEAIIDRLFVKAPYEPVRAGQPLASILAPDWSTALAEANALAGADSESAKALRPAARARLRALGLPSGASVRNGRIVLTSPTSGVVSEIGAREGMSAPAGTLLFRINGTETVWLRADIPQAGTAAIRPGTPVQARVSALPGRVIEGRVETLLPQLDPGSRTQQARIVLENEDGLLAPGMFAQISLAPLDGAEHVLVPSDAVIGSGDEARVIVMDDGRFRPVAVQVGRSSGGTTEILAGLKGGERVVASGQFLIDSEASLSGALQRLDTPAESGEESATPDEAPTEPAE
ncbi:MAG: efflux RND transporter periplasmic adaptor subunit, partial [Lysobacter sp.]|nr:efflux RND transporter periplasmic adaptor subunit [Lysobacter sp.]